MEATELTLRWEKFGLSRGLHEMLASKDLVDVTIACQGEYMHAHKTVLAACSTQFRNIFLTNPCQHPIIFMQDSKLSHLQAVLNFMYTGEATVLQHELAGFMKTAEALKVSGLTTPAQGPGPVLHQKKADVGVSPSKKQKTASQAQSWVNLQGMKMETPGVYIVEPNQLQAMDTELTETERAVESVEAHEEEEENQEDDDNFAGDDNGDPDWFDESGKEHDEGNTSQPSTSAGVSSRDVPGFLAELEDYLINGQSSTSEEHAAVQHIIQEEVLSNIPTIERKKKVSRNSNTSSDNKYGKTYGKEPQNVKNKKPSNINTKREESESDEEELEMFVDSDDSDYEPPLRRKPRHLHRSSLRRMRLKYPMPIVNTMKYRTKYPKEIHSPNPCRCSLCGTEKLYKNGNSLMQHIYRYHSGNFSERQMCYVCTYTFATLSVLKRHLLQKHSPNFDPITW